MFDMKRSYKQGGMTKRDGTMIDKAVTNYILDIARKSGNLYTTLLDKATRLQNPDKFDTRLDDFSLRVANSAMSQFNKMQDRQLKEREVKTGEISQFHKLLKDANSGNITKETIIELEKQADKGASSSDKDAVAG